MILLTNKIKGMETIMELNSKQMKKAFVLISFGIILMWALNNLNSIWGVLAGFFSLITPFIIGIVIAFIMNIPMSFIEKKIFKKMSLKYKRPIAYVITLLLFLLIIFVTLFIVVPEFYNSVQEIISRVPLFWENLLNRIENTKLTENKYINNYITSISIDWAEVEGWLVNLLTNQASGWVRSTFNVATSVVGTVISIGIGFVFSIYILLQKEKLFRQIRKTSLAIFSKKVYEKLLYLADLINKSFSNFFSAQLLEAIIVGLMFFIAMNIFNYPYPLVISVLIGITSFIPIVGAFIGAIVGALLIAVVDLKLAFWFIIMFLIIQQIEGNLIYPHVAGKTIGLPSIWVFVAVILGGGLFGIIGIILFVPMTTVLYVLLKDFVNTRLRKKSMIHDGTENESAEEEE